MQGQALTSAVRAAISSARGLGLHVEDGVVVHNSNRIAVRLLPCDVLARVAAGWDGRRAGFEVELTRLLAEAGSPVAALDPRVAPGVYAQDGFEVTFWTYYEVGSSTEVAPGDYARALSRLHAGMRRITAPPAPHFTDRVAGAQRVVGDPDQSPDLGAAGRRLLRETLQEVTLDIRNRRAAEQLLHGEPHPGNLMPARDGVLFFDFETCCHGPVEFDVAHAPDAVGDEYPGLDQELLRDCRILALAIATAWRWDRHDQLPDGHRLGLEWLDQLRSMRSG